MENSRSYSCLDPTGLGPKSGVFLNRKLNEAATKHSTMVDDAIKASDREPKPPVRAKCDFKERRRLLEHNKLYIGRKTTSVIRRGPAMLNSR